MGHVVPAMKSSEASSGQALLHTHLRYFFGGLPRPDPSVHHLCFKGRGYSQKELPNNFITEAISRGWAKSSDFVRASTILPNRQPAAKSGQWSFDILPSYQYVAGKDLSQRVKISQVCALSPVPHLMKPKTTIPLILAILAAAGLFHFSILLKFIPYEFTWGGRLKSDQEMYIFETLSLALNLFMGFVVLIRGGYLQPYLPAGAVRVFLWIFLVLFSLNTLGNLFAETNFEKFFALVTLAEAVLFGSLLFPERSGKQNSQG